MGKDLFELVISIWIHVDRKSKGSHAINNRWLETLIKLKYKQLQGCFAITVFPRLALTRTGALTKTCHNLRLAVLIFKIFDLILSCRHAFLGIVVLLNVS